VIEEVLPDFDQTFGMQDIPRNIMVLSLAKSYLKLGRPEESIVAAKSALLNTIGVWCADESCDYAEPSSF